MNSAPPTIKVGDGRSGKQSRTSTYEDDWRFTELGNLDASVFEDGQFLSTQELSMLTELAEEEFEDESTFDQAYIDGASTSCSDYEEDEKSTQQSTTIDIEILGDMESRNTEPVGANAPNMDAALVVTAQGAVVQSKAPTGSLPADVKMLVKPPSDLKRNFEQQSASVAVDKDFKTKTLEELQQQGFEGLTSASSPGRRDFAATTGDMRAMLERLAETGREGTADEDQEREFFASLSLTEYVSCGTILTQRLAEAIAGLGHIREEKRKLLLTFEKELADRNITITSNEDFVCRRLEGLRKSGGKLVAAEH